ncbi:hypothetical protein GGX14DRAFT_629977 [Mycena pura]|uniref:Uncharacterized protein n=1 Tax=Mycena pura TaxID=153505 RepID=A0AAD6YRY0_9AGAR|nr:hypothetical protein GGX14DRAFT_629977 [Mycena pura]
MEYYPEESNLMYGGRSVAAQRPAEMFGNATGFGIDRSHFTNVEGGMHIHPIVPNSLAPGSHLALLAWMWNISLKNVFLRAASASSNAGTETVGVTAPPQEVDDVYSENEMYCSQLLGRQRGYPLYVPGPQRNLPREYRTNGVAIGDVGMVTPEGIWDFFFNIFLPADDPINGNNVPNGFSPLEPYHPADVLHLDFEAGTYVCSSSVHGYHPEVNFEDFPGGDFHFNCRGPKGALLALPHGSHLEKLRNQEQMRQYAMENAESWYRYINRTRGRRMANGELYLITGCEKSRAGGMATFQHVSAGNDFNVVYKAFPDVNTMGIKYRFNRGTPAQTKTFAQSSPGRHIHGLNNTIFLHGFTISLGEGLWGNLFGRAGICQTLNSPFREPPSGYIPFGSQGSIFSYSLNFLTGGGGTAGKQNSASGGEEVTVSELSRTPKIVHPSRIINDLVLRKVPHTTLVITHDDDWRDIFQHDGNVLNTSDLIQHFFEIKEENGAAYLAAKSGSSPVSQNLNGNVMPDLPDIVTTQVARKLEALYAYEPASLASQARRPTPPRTNVIGESDIDDIASAATNSPSLSSENESDESSARLAQGYA